MTEFGLLTNLLVVPTNLHGLLRKRELPTIFLSLSLDLTSLPHQLTRICHQLTKLHILRSDEVYYDSFKLGFEQCLTEMQKYMQCAGLEHTP